MGTLILTSSLPQFTRRFRCHQERKKRDYSIWFSLGTNCIATMSQHTLKRTVHVCGGNHSRMHCVVICNSCGGDKCKCECEAQSAAAQRKKDPSKWARQQQRSESESWPDEAPTYQQLCWEYKKLQKRNAEFGKVYQSLQKQHKELVANQQHRDEDLKEANNDAEELADMVGVKDGVIKVLQASLTAAKDEIAQLRDELSRQSVPSQPTADSNPDA